MLQSSRRCSGFKLSKATGDCAGSVNGFYKQMGEVVNGRAVYIKLDSEGDPRCCWYDPDGNWMVSGTANKDANKGSGYAKTTATGLPHPALPDEAWKVAVGGKFVDQPEVTVEALQSEADVVR